MIGISMSARTPSARRDPIRQQPTAQSVPSTTQPMVDAIATTTLCQIAPSQTSLVARFT